MKKIINNYNLKYTMSIIIQIIRVKHTHKIIYNIYIINKNKNKENKLNKDYHKLQLLILVLMQKIKKIVRNLD